MGVISSIRERIKAARAAHPKGRPFEGNRFIPDPVPVAPPVGYKKQPSMVEVVREMVRSERLRNEVQAAGMETFEEADDFNVGDDYDPKSPYEEQFDPVDNEIDRRLTSQEFDAKVNERLGQAQSRLEAKHGNPAVEQGRGRSGSGSVGRSREKLPDQPAAVEESANKRSVPKADGGRRSVEE